MRKRRLAYVPLHRFSLIVPSELYERVVQAVPDGKSITQWIVEAIQEKLQKTAEKGE